ncbi:MAG: glycoside hydrolase family 9 protein, partial [Bacteroidota bacterium]
SGNGIADILDEIIWELEWMEKMMNSDGSVHIKMGSVEWNHNNYSPPSNNFDPRYYGPTCTSASIALAHVFAHAALVFQSIPLLQSYADTLESKAITCFAHVLPNLNANSLDTNCDNGLIKAGDADVSSSKQKEYGLLAALYLFELTGSTLYKNYISSNINDALAISNNWVGPEATSIVDALLKYRTLDGADQSVINEINNSFTPHITQDWDGFFGMNNNDLYRANMPDWAYHWGSNRPKAHFGVLNLVIEKHNFNTSQNASYNLKAEEIVHYFHGVNPQNMVYLSNMYDYGAEWSVNQIYHTWFKDGSDYDDALTSLYGPAPGYVTGGPNKDYTYNGLNPPYGQPPQKAYLEFNPSTVPENSWEITEPAIYYQAAYVRLLASFSNAVNACNANVLYVNNAASGNADGSPWQDAFTDLSSALSSDCIANTDTIKISKGLYIPNTNNRSFKFGINKDLVVQGGFDALGNYNPNVNTVTISGNIGDANLNSDNLYHVIYISDSQLDIVLQDISIEGGNANGSGIDSMGGGILNAGKLTLYNIDLINNSALNNNAKLHLLPGSELIIQESL